MGFIVEGGWVPADSSAFDSNCDFAFFKAFTFLDFLECGAGFFDPEFVGWVGEDANVRLGDCVRDNGHGGGV